MTYVPQIPLTGESLGSTRARINTNFQQIDTIMAVNHVAFNSSGEGKHKFLQMPEQAAAPTTAANEAALYTKVDPISPTETALFYRGESDDFEYQMTKPISASTSQFAVNSSYGAPPAGFTQTGGWTFLPGGIILQYGNYGKTVATGTSGTIQFPVTFPTSVFSVVATVNGVLGTYVATNNVSTSNFLFTSGNSSANQIQWYAIGN